MTETFNGEMSDWQLRLARPEDEEFLFRLFADTQEHLAAFRPNQALYQSLVAGQYQGRKMSYAAEYPDAVNAILCEGDEAVGRLLMDCRGDTWRIVDIAVLAEHRGRGLGGWVLKLCQQQCGEAGARLMLAVRPENPARRLYERMGFRVIHEDVLTVEMEWKADAADAAHSTNMELLTGNI
jgi:ribosomal protein S18 acetylase RimI-like enzyme